MEIDKIVEDARILGKLLKEKHHIGKITVNEQMEVKEYLKMLLEKSEEKKKNTAEIFEFHQMQRNLMTQINEMRRYDSL